MSTARLLLYILIMAAVTYAIRVLPLILFRKPIRSPFIRSFLYYIPYAVLGAMTIPAIFFATDSLFSAIVGLVVAVIAAWHKKGLLTVAAAACLAVYFTQWLITVF
ncbi:AzlD domain-containing protein [Pseudoramibacter faecis]|uniref:AzlD domain-containing protein n=1 Tax=Pseudoramibacter faecis TaxID=3108534 RepID=UPI002E79CAFD|nr:AzlD domain-containing protein [Pseudoramibacter sp. HA2172]